MLVSVERTAGTMMQRMSDMLTRWLEGAMQRAENETEADENQQQSENSGEHDSSPLTAQTNPSAVVEERVESSLQDVANLRLSPSPVNDADERICEVVNDVLSAASREVEENISHVCDTSTVLTDKTSVKPDNLAVSSDIDSTVDSQLDYQNTSNRNSQADNNTNTLHSTPEPEGDITKADFADTSAVGEPDSNELVDTSSSSVDADVSTEMSSQCGQITVTVEEDTEAESVKQTRPSHC